MNFFWFLQWEHLSLPAYLAHDQTIWLLDDAISANTNRLIRLEAPAGISDFFEEKVENCFSVHEWVE